MIFGLDTIFLCYGLIIAADGTSFAFHETAGGKSWKSSSEEAHVRAKDALKKAKAPGRRSATLAVLDFTLPSYLPRLQLYRRGRPSSARLLCSHGRGSGECVPHSFSNTHRSNQTSLGLYRVGSIYTGKYGKSLRLHGLEKGKNDQAYSRSIVLHAAWYADREVIVQNILEGYGPRLGRSRGCPAISPSDLETVLASLPPGSYLYIHGK
ncbi:MAG: murein L,D-transpeptidase catalytic domain family protein [Verrucomicrobiota bacterium]